MNNLKLILFLFFLSKTSLKKYFIYLGLLRTNAQCPENCDECHDSSSCTKCNDGYPYWDEIKQKCVGKESAM